MCKEYLPVAGIKNFPVRCTTTTMDLFGNIPLVLKRNQKVEEGRAVYSQSGL